MSSGHLAAAGKGESLGPGSDARSVQPFPAFMSDGSGGRIPVRIVPKTSDPPPTESSKHWLACAMDDGELKLVELEVYTDNGNLYMRKVAGKAQSGYATGQAWEGNFAQEANAAYPGALPQENLEVTGVQYTKATEGEEPTTQRVEAGIITMDVDDVTQFCNNAHETVKNAIEEQMPGVICMVRDCSPRSGGRRLGGSAKRRLSKGSVAVTYNLFLPAGSGGQGPLDDMSTQVLSEQINNHSPVHVSVEESQTPRSKHRRSSSSDSPSSGSRGSGGDGGLPLESMPADGNSLSGTDSSGIFPYTESMKKFLVVEVAKSPHAPWVLLAGAAGLVSLLLGMSRHGCLHDREGPRSSQALSSHGPLDARNEATGIAAE